MYRPLMNRGIVELEQMFEEAEDDPKVLRGLADELECRNTNRALALLTEVQSALSSQGSKAAKPAAQFPLLPIASEIESQPQLQSKTVTRTPARELRVGGQSSQASSGREAIGSVAVEAARLPLTLEAAYRILKVSGSASWQSVELARRGIVQRASPEALEGESDLSRSVLLTRASEANLACARIWLERYPSTS